MRLRVLAVGQKMPAWVDQGVKEYARRLPREMPVEWHATGAQGRLWSSPAAQ